ncbi:MAG TPA: hypothetical protein VKX17_13830 [Planctomycetota bacterium]|nr:hypothetical protein [Planctomycetota bacterium]
MESIRANQTDEPITNIAATEAGKGASPVVPLELPGIFDRLARLPGQSILDEKALAEAFGVTPRTIRRMVSRHELPPGIPFAGKTVWLANKVLAYLEAKLDRVAADAERRARAVEKHLV